MLFNSLGFAVFLPVVFIIYWLLPQKYRWVLLLISSYYFYMSWNVKYVALILFTTCVSYFAGILIEKAETKKRKTLFLLLTLISCVGVLIVFKYTNFIIESIARLAGLISIQLSPYTVKLLLPVGISFYTFQTLSYVIDVYRGDIKAEKHFGYYAAFISFFPQLVAGPIERASKLLPQIKGEHSFNYNKATYGLKLMGWGFFKKLCIADILSQYVKIVYENPTNYKGFSLVLATVFFSIQIYCDFSGYSDIAIGTAKLMDIDLMTNFKSPYFSKSIKEFWSRWHISLSTWFKDYLYIPMGGSRVGRTRHSFNLFVTFLVSGLWHGANWTFVVWGALHGMAQIFENIFIPNKMQKSRLFVFLFCTFAWIFFASSSLSDAMYIVKHLFDGISSPMQYFQYGISDLGYRGKRLLIMICMIVVLGIYDWISLKEDVILKVSSMKAIIRWPLYILFVVGAFFVFTLYGVSNASFVYFQF